MSFFDEEKIISELKGNTLRVYWALLNSKDGIIGVRELQRKLGFSSPGLASYHLNKLSEMKLVEKERGDYRLIREVRVGVLKQFIKLGTFLLPRYVLYSTMFTTLLLFLITQIKELNFYSSFALILGLLSSVISWYESIRIWRQKP
jgi:DNA-binding transcriptional ArsR family regulator